MNRIVSKSIMFAIGLCTVSLSGHPKEIEEWTKLIMRTEHGQEEFKRNPSFLKNIPLSQFTKTEIKNQLQKAILAQNKNLQNDLSSLNLEQMLLVYHISHNHFSIKDTPAVHALFNSLPSQLQQQFACNK